MERYSRHKLFSGIRESGQQKLHNSKVAILGCGALGCFQVESLARAGIGYLRIIDRDYVEVSNLQRQILFNELDAKQQIPKSIAAKEYVRLINSEIEVESIVDDVTSLNIEELISNMDLVLDGTDNFETRFLLNDACIKHNIPWIYGAAVGAFGLTMTVIPRETSCLRCLMNVSPTPGTFETCDTAGIILPAIATIASAQITETLKYLVGQKDKLRGTLLQIDLWENSYKSLNLPNWEEIKDCICCKQQQYEFLDNKNRQTSSILCGSNSVQISPSIETTKFNLDFDELSVRLNKIGKTTANNFLLRFQIDNYTITIFRNARAIIKGTSDISTARALYAKYIGS